MLRPVIEFAIKQEIETFWQFFGYMVYTGFHISSV